MLQLVDKPRDAKAWDRFLQLGAWAKEHETFRYVHLKELYSHSFALPKEPGSAFEVEGGALVFVNGTYRADLSQPPQSLIALPLSQALKTYGSFLNARNQKQLKEEKDPFALLNSAYFSEGLFLYVPPKSECSLKIVHIMDSFEKPTLLSPRIHLFAGKEASAHFSFSQRMISGNVFVNAFIDCALDEKASVTLTALFHPHEAAHDFLALRATLKQNCHFKSYAITKGAMTSRQDYDIRLQGESGNASLYGVWDLKGHRQHHVNVLMDHQQPGCTSLQKFKGVLTDTSRSSFEGKIYVHPQAQKTEAYQMSNNLVLSERASAYAKPNLEIFADDVKASHGATIGQLQEEELFYLTTRGVPLSSARSLLIQAFWHEIIDLIEDTQLKKEAFEVLA